MTGLPRQAAGASLSHSRAQLVRWARGGPARSPAPLCGTEGAPMRHRPFLWTDHFHENCVQISEQMPSGINLTHKRKVPHAVSPTEPLGWSTEHPARQTAHATVLGLLLLLWAPRQKAQPARHTACQAHCHCPACCSQAHRNSCPAIWGQSCRCAVLGNSTQMAMAKVLISLVLHLPFLLLICPARCFSESLCGCI